MKNLQICVAAVALLGFAVVASAADRAVSKSTLGSMGLGSMKVLADNDGLAVRGQGTSASVSGTTSNSLFGNTATSNYAAAAAHNYGSSKASGSGFTAVNVGPFHVSAISAAHASAH